MDTTTALTLNPKTANFALSLHHFEMAVDQFVSGMREFRGEPADWETGLTPEETEIFDKARDLIKSKLMDKIELWANTLTPGTEV